MQLEYGRQYTNHFHALDVASDQEDETVCMVSAVYGFLYHACFSASKDCWSAPCCISLLSHDVSTLSAHGLNRDEGILNLCHLYTCHD